MVCLLSVEASAERVTEIRFLDEVHESNSVTLEFTPSALATRAWPSSGPTLGGTRGQVCSLLRTSRMSPPH